MGEKVKGVSTFDENLLCTCGGTLISTVERFALSCSDFICESCSAQYAVIGDQLVCVKKGEK